MPLERLLTDMHRLVPEYKVHIHSNPSLRNAAFEPPAGAHLFRFDADDAPMYIGMLHDALVRAHPSAGRIYWSTAAWRTLTWAPVFFSLLAVHGLGRAMPLRGFGLYVTADSILGHACGEQPVIDGHDRDLVAHAGKQLARVFACLHEGIAFKAPFGVKLAQKLYTDYIAQGLILLNERFHDRLRGGRALTQAQLESRLAEWLEASGLPPAEGTLLLPTGKLGLKRQVCCQHYRTSGGEECADCTRIAMDRRIVLMMQASHA